MLKIIKNKIINNFLQAFILLDKIFKQKNIDKKNSNLKNNKIIFIFNIKYFFKLYLL